VCGDCKTIEVFGEILHHIVSFGLAVHEHIQTKFFFQPNNAPNFFAHCFFVGGLIDLAPRKLRAGDANLVRLRERANRRGGYFWQLETDFLRSATYFIVFAFEVGAYQACRASTDSRVDNSRRAEALSIGVFDDRNFGGDRVPPLGQPSTKGDHLTDFFVGKNRPASQIFAERALIFHAGVARG
jgi:hypothetical protein